MKIKAKNYRPDENQNNILKAMLLTYKDFLKICEENDVRFIAAYGTAIGAIREQGFIPWDDDMDICVWEEDMDKLMNAVNKSENLTLEIGRERQLQNVLKIYDKRFVCKRYGGRVKRKIFIDVFPLYKNKRVIKSKWKSIKLALLEFICTVKKFTVKEVRGDEGFGIAVGYSIMKMLLLVIPTRILTNKVRKLINKLPQEKNIKNKRYDFTHQKSFEYTIDKIIKTKFEDTYTYINSGFAKKDSYAMYGNDVMERPEYVGESHGVIIENFKEKK